MYLFAYFKATHENIYINLMGISIPLVDAYIRLPPSTRVQPRGPSDWRSVYLDRRVGPQTPQPPQGKVYWDVEVEEGADGGGVMVGVAQTRAGLMGEVWVSDAAMMLGVSSGMRVACVCVLMGPSGVVHQHSPRAPAWSIRDVVHEHAEAMRDTTHRLSCVCQHYNLF